MYLALVHHPTRTKTTDEMVTTSVTNLDIHDISRTCRTYGFKRYFIVTPLEKQHALVSRILGHWSEGVSREYNPDRHDALGLAELAPSLEHVRERIKELSGERPFEVVTGANFEESDGDEKLLLQRPEIDTNPILLVFGTGQGLHAQVVNDAQFMLDPLRGDSDDGYNHLSVRSAVAIYCDRLLEAKRKVQAERGKG